MSFQIFALDLHSSVEIYQKEKKVNEFENLKALDLILGQLFEKKGYRVHSIISKDKFVNYGIAQGRLLEMIIFDRLSFEEAKVIFLSIRSLNFLTCKLKCHIKYKRAEISVTYQTYENEFLKYLGFRVTDNLTESQYIEIYKAHIGRLKHLKYVKDTENLSVEGLEQFSRLIYVQTNCIKYLEDMSCIKIFKRNEEIRKRENSTLDSSCLKTPSVRRSNHILEIWHSSIDYSDSYIKKHTENLKKQRENKNTGRFF